MSILTRWLLIPPVNARLIGRYREYRRHGASPFSATLGCFWLILARVFIPLEHPRWQRIRAEHKNLYPHINAARPRPLDPVRYVIQTCWLLISASRRETAKPRWRSFHACRIFVVVIINGWMSFRLASVITRNILMRKRAGPYKRRSTALYSWHHRDVLADSGADLRHPAV